MSTLATLGTTMVLLLATSACSSGDDANVEACDGVGDVLTQINEDVSAAGSDEQAVADAYETAAGTLDDLAATEGIDGELADQLGTGAEAARAEAAGENDDPAEPDRSIRAAVDLCSDLRG